SQCILLAVPFDIFLFGDLALEKLIGCALAGGRRLDPCSRRMPASRRVLGGFGFRPHALSRVTRKSVVSRHSHGNVKPLTRSPFDPSGKPRFPRCVLYRLHNGSYFGGRAGAGGGTGFAGLGTGF